MPRKMRKQHFLLQHEKGKFLTFLIKMRLVRIIITLATFFLTLKGITCLHSILIRRLSVHFLRCLSPPLLCYLSFPGGFFSLPSPEELSSRLLYDLEEDPVLFFFFPPSFFSFFSPLIQKSFLDDLRK